MDQVIYFDNSNFHVHLILFILMSVTKHILTHSFLFSNIIFFYWLRYIKNYKIIRKNH